MHAQADRRLFAFYWPENSKDRKEPKDMMLSVEEILLHRQDWCLGSRLRTYAMMPSKHICHISNNLCSLLMEHS